MSDQIEQEHEEAAGKCFRCGCVMQSTTPSKTPREAFNSDAGDGPFCLGCWPDRNLTRLERIMKSDCGYDICSHGDGKYSHCRGEYPDDCDVCFLLKELDASAARNRRLEAAIGDRGGAPQRLAMEEMCHKQATDLRHHREARKQTLEQLKMAETEAVGAFAALRVRTDYESLMSTISNRIDSLTKALEAFTERRPVPTEAISDRAKMADTFTSKMRDGVSETLRRELARCKWQLEAAEAMANATSEGLIRCYRMSETNLTYSPQCDCPACRFNWARMIYNDRVAGREPMPAEPMPCPICREDVEATAKCDGCGKYVCGHCADSHGDKWLCSQCKPAEPTPCATCGGELKAIAECLDCGQFTKIGDGTVTP